MEIRSTRQDGTASLEVRGELDIGTAPQLAEAVDAALDDGCREVVLDLAGTTFVDSAGLGALVTAARAVDQRRGKMAVVSPRGSEARVLIEMTRTDGILGLREP
jgi:anti-sigma B factor antagonist